MTTKLSQSSLDFLVAAESNPTVAQSAISFLVRNFSLAAPSQVSQSAVTFLVRKTKYAEFINWKPACSVELDPNKQDL